MPPTIPAASNSITWGYGPVDRHAFIDHAFLCFFSNKSNAIGLGSIKRPDHPNCVSNNKVFEISSPSYAPASTKNPSLLPLVHLFYLEPKYV